MVGKILQELTGLFLPALRGVIFTMPTEDRLQLPKHPTLNTRNAIGRMVQDEAAVGLRLPVDSSTRRTRQTPNIYLACARRVPTAITCTEREHRSRRSVYRRADKIGRRGRTPTVAPQAYRSRRRWEKNSSVNKMVLTLLVVGGRTAIALHPGSPLSRDGRRRDRAAPSLLRKPPLASILPFQHGRLPSPSADLSSSERQQPSSLSPGSLSSSAELVLRLSPSLSFPLSSSPGTFRVFV